MTRLITFALASVVLYWGFNNKGGLGLLGYLCGLLMVAAVFAKTVIDLADGKQGLVVNILRAFWNHL